MHMIYKDNTIIKKINIITITNINVILYYAKIIVRLSLFKMM